MNWNVVVIGVVVVVQVVVMVMVMVMMMMMMIMMMMMMMMTTMMMMMMTMTSTTVTVQTCSETASAMRLWKCFRDKPFRVRLLGRGSKLAKKYRGVRFENGCWKGT